MKAKHNLIFSFFIEARGQNATVWNWEGSGGQVLALQLSDRLAAVTAETPPPQPSPEPARADLETFITSALSDL